MSPRRERNPVAWRSVFSLLPRLSLLRERLRGERTPRWTPFAVDTNQGWGLIESAAEWKAFLDHVVIGRIPVDRLLRTRMAHPHEPQLPPCFGTRGEHSGSLTLEEWSRRQGMDLRAAA